MPAPANIAGIKEKLDAERARLLESFRDLPAEIITRPAEDGWSIKDLLAHLAMAEGVNVKFAKLMVAKNSPAQLDELAADYPDFPLPFTLDKFNAYMTNRLRAKSWVEVVQALHATRAETLAWLAKLAPADLERRGGHAVWGTQTVNGMFRILVIHEKAHRGDIEKRVTRGK
ncbi:MAG: DinB family protein [Chloroflexi bacterium]|nr:DinB family protein [Chloroflexota bacterium]